MRPRRGGIAQRPARGMRTGEPHGGDRGCFTIAMPTVEPPPCTRENSPAGRPQAATARTTAWPTSSAVPGCARCALTITGQPAARAEAVSPPATEKARGKLLEPNTTTGPSGISMRRRSGRGSGWRSGRAGRCGRQPTNPRAPPARRAGAGRRCGRVRPCRRAGGRPVSAWARWSRVSPSASISAAMVSRSLARVSGGRPVILKRRGGGLQGGVHLGERGFMEIRRERFTRRGIDGAENWCRRWRRCGRRGDFCLGAAWEVRRWN
jgi:hypothetical protein